MAFYPHVIASSSCYQNIWKKRRMNSRKIKSLNFFADKIVNQVYRPELTAGNANQACLMVEQLI